MTKHVGLRRHYQQKHGVQDEKSLGKVIKPNVNKCSKCNKRFSCRRYLLKHFRRMHKNEILPQKKGTVTKVQHQEVHIIKKESEGGTKLEVLSKDTLAKRKEC